MFLELKFVKLEFQPKIEFPKLDLLLDPSDLDWKKKEKEKVELEFSKLEFHLNCKELEFARLEFQARKK